MRKEMVQKIRLLTARPSTRNCKNCCWKFIWIFWAQSWTAIWVRWGEVELRSQFWSTQSSSSDVDMYTPVLSPCIIRPSLERCIDVQVTLHTISLLRCQLSQLFCGMSDNTQRRTRWGGPCERFHVWWRRDVVTSSAPRASFRCLGFCIVLEEELIELCFAVAWNLTFVRGEGFRRSRGKQPRIGVGMWKVPFPFIELHPTVFIRIFWKLWRPFSVSCYDLNFDHITLSQNFFKKQRRSTALAWGIRSCQV